MTVSQAFKFHFKCCSILHFAVCQLPCWAFLLCNGEKQRIAVGRLTLGCAVINWSAAPPSGFRAPLSTLVCRSPARLPARTHAIRWSTARPPVTFARMSPVSGTKDDWRCHPPPVPWSRRACGAVPCRTRHGTERPGMRLRMRVGTVGRSVDATPPTEAITSASLCRRRRRRRCRLRRPRRRRRCRHQHRSVDLLRPMVKRSTSLGL